MQEFVKSGRQEWPPDANSHKIALIRTISECKHHYRSRVEFKIHANLEFLRMDSDFQLLNSASRTKL
jgi:hypothetical protein